MDGRVAGLELRLGDVSAALEVGVSDVGTLVRLAVVVRSLLEGFAPTPDHGRLPRLTSSGLVNLTLLCNKINR